MSEVAVSVVIVLPEHVDEPLGSTMVLCSAAHPPHPLCAPGRPVATAILAVVPMVVVNAVVDELGAAVQAVVPIVVKQPMVDELGAATGAALRVLDTMEPTVAPTVAELAEVAKTIRSIHCVVVEVDDGATDRVSAGPMV